MGVRFFSLLFWPWFTLTDIASFLCCTWFYSNWSLFTQFEYPDSGLGFREGTGFFNLHVVLLPPRWQRAQTLQLVHYVFNGQLNLMEEVVCQYSYVIINVVKTTTIKDKPNNDFLILNTSVTCTTLPLHFHSYLLMCVCVYLCVSLSSPVADGGSGLTWAYKRMGRKSNQALALTLAHHQHRSCFVL